MIVRVSVVLAGPGRVALLLTANDVSNPVQIS